METEDSKLTLPDLLEAIVNRNRYLKSAERDYLLKELHQAYRRIISNIESNFGCPRVYVKTYPNPSLDSEYTLRGKFGAEATIMTKDLYPGPESNPLTEGVTGDLVKCGVGHPLTPTDKFNIATTPIDEKVKLDCGCRRKVTYDMKQSVKAKQPRG